MTANSTPESFDAVLAEMRDAQRAYAGDHASGTIRRLADRLQSAHARELAEQQATIEALRAELAACDRNLADAMNVIAAGDTRADAAMGLLRDAAIDKKLWASVLPDTHERIDAFLAQQALAGGERKDG